MKINKKAYSELIKEDIEWLYANTYPSAERDHIKSILNSSVKFLYPEKPKAIPYQKCPICSGMGWVANLGNSTSSHFVCDVCNGTKIIPMKPIGQ